MAVETKITFDMREFQKFTREAPGVMDGLVKQSFERAGAKIRKEFHKTIDRGVWADLQETPEYRSKYTRPLQMLKAMIRYRTTGGNKRITTTVGIFPGKAGRSKLNNSQFKQRYGVTVARFGKLMTYGGKLRIRGQKDRRRMVRQGFHVSSRTKYLQFPKRDWYSKTRMKEPSRIIPYIQKDLNERVARRLNK